MRITEITIGLTTSVKIAPYEYAKPEFSATASVDEGDKVEDVITYLKEVVNQELTKITERLQNE